MRIPLLSMLTILLATAAAFAQAQPQTPFTGSVPTGQVTATTLDLSLREAIDRALKYNLGLIEGGQNTRIARAERLRSLNVLLPNLSARISAELEQINLRSVGFNPNIPGIHIPVIVGPFGVADARL